MIDKLAARNRTKPEKIAEKIDEIIDVIEKLREKVNYLSPPKQKRFFRRNIYD